MKIKARVRESGRVDRDFLPQDILERDMAVTILIDQRRLDEPSEAQIKALRRELGRMVDEMYQRLDLELPARAVVQVKVPGEAPRYGVLLAVKAGHVVLGSVDTETGKTYRWHVLGDCQVREIGGFGLAGLWVQLTCGDPSSLVKVEALQAIKKDYVLLEQIARLSKDVKVRTEAQMLLSLRNEQGVQSMVGDDTENMPSGF